MGILDNNLTPAQLRRLGGSRQGESISTGGALRLGARNPSAACVFTFDDIPANTMFIVRPLLRARGINAVHAAPSSFVGANNCLTAAQLRQLQAEGDEIASHSVTHTDPATQTDAQILTEIRDSRTALEALGLTINNYIYPYGRHNATGRANCRLYYRSGVGVTEAANGGLVSGVQQPLRTYGLRRISITNTGPNNTLAYYKAQVDAAVSGKQLLIFLVHSGFDLDATQQQNLADLMDYAMSVMPVLTLQQALDRVGNLLDTGDYTGGTAYHVVTADGTPHTSAAGTRILTQNTFSNTAARTAFPAGIISVMPFNAQGNLGFPTSAGILYTDRAAVGLADNTYSSWDRQTLYDFYSDKIWQRRATSNTAWSPWVRIDAGSIVTVLASGTANNTTGYKSFAAGQTSIMPFLAGDNAGFPTSAGKLITDRTAGDDLTYPGYCHQTVLAYNSARSWRRAATGDTTWGDWWPLATGPAPVVGNVAFGAAAAGGVTGATVTVTGATTGDSVIVNPASALEAGLVVQAAFVSAANTVAIYLQNVTGASITPATRQWTVRVIRP